MTDRQTVRNRDRERERVREREREQREKSETERKKNIQPGRQRDRETVKERGFFHDNHCKTYSADVFVEVFPTKTLVLRRLMSEATHLRSPEDT